MSYDLHLPYSAIDNFIPDGTATAPLQAITHGETVELEAPEGSTNQLHVQLEQLEKEKDHFLKSCRIHQAPSAPIGKVPTETLGIIFIHCLPALNIAESYLIPFTLANVCRQWRCVAIGTPRLWTVLPVETPIRMDPHVFVRICLAFSGSLPITLHLSKDHRSWSRGSGKDAMQMVFMNLHRVGCIVGSPGPLFACELAAQNTPIQAPLLKTIELDRFQRPFDENQLTRLSGIIRAPNLVSLALKKCANFLPVFCRDPVELQHLTLSSGVDHPLVPLINVVSQASNLQTLDIDLTSLHLPSNGLSQRTLHSLQELTITIDSDVDIRAILGSLRVPLLEIFTLISWDFIDLGSLGPLFLTTGRPPRLRELTFEHGTLHSARFIHLISKLPMLQTLCLIDCSPVEYGMLSALIIDHSVSPDHWICPRLQSITLNYMEIDGDLVVQIVQSRAPLVTMEASVERCLRNFNAWECPGLTSAHSSALERINEGCGYALDLDVVVFEP